MRTYLIAIAVALAMAPLAYAHKDAGTPKNYCEPQGEWLTHDYGPVGTQALIYGNEDGNLLGNCDGVTTLNPGTPCAGLENPDDPLSFYVGLCDSDFNLPVADWDGHNEFAFGGAWILVSSGDGTPSGDPTLGAGTAYCFGAEGHHAKYGPFLVEDIALETGVLFSVASDTVDITESPSGCGDFESDNSSDCIDTCKVTFLPGLDGAYVVYVQGAAGHVITFEE
jgi:hypothetical protein